MAESGEWPKDYRPGRTSSSSSSSSTTSIHVTALDGIVNVNSLFTIAVFVGLSLTTPGQHSLENPSACDAGVDIAKKLLVFEVVSFSFFLFSSLVAQGLKLAINLLNSKDVDEAFRAHINLKVLRLGMMASAVGSVMGFGAPFIEPIDCRAFLEPKDEYQIVFQPPQEESEEQEEKIEEDMSREKVEEEARQGKAAIIA